MSPWVWFQILRERERYLTFLNNTSLGLENDSVGNVLTKQAWGPELESPQPTESQNRECLSAIEVLLWGDRRQSQEHLWNPARLVDTMATNKGLPTGWKARTGTWDCPLTSACALWQAHTLSHIMNMHTRTHSTHTLCTHCPHDGSAGKSTCWASLSSVQGTHTKGRESAPKSCPLIATRTPWHVCTLALFLS